MSNTKDNFEPKITPRTPNSIEEDDVESIASDIQVHISHSEAQHQEIDTRQKTSSNGTLTTLNSETPLRTQEVMCKRVQAPKDQLEYIVEVFQSKRDEEIGMNSMDLELNETEFASDKDVPFCVISIDTRKDEKSQKQDSQNCCNLLKWNQLHPRSVDKYVLVWQYIFMCFIYTLQAGIAPNSRWLPLGLVADVILQLIAGDILSIIGSLAAAATQLAYSLFHLNPRSPQLQGGHVQLTSTLSLLFCIPAGLIGATQPKQHLARILAALCSFLYGLAAFALVRSGKVLSQVVLQSDPNIVESSVANKRKLVILYSVVGARRDQFGHLQFGEYTSKSVRLYPQLLFRLKQLLKLCIIINCVASLFSVQSFQDWVWQIFAYIGLISTFVMIVVGYLISLRCDVNIDFGFDTFVCIILNIVWSLGLIGQKSKIFVLIIVVIFGGLLSIFQFLQKQIEINLERRFLVLFTYLFLAYLTLDYRNNVLIINVFSKLLIACAVLNFPFIKLLNDKYLKFNESLLLISILLLFANILHGFVSNDEYRREAALGQIGEILFWVSFVMFFCKMTQQLSKIITILTFQFISDVVYFLLALSQIAICSHQLYLNVKIAFYDVLSIILTIIFIYVILLFAIRAVILILKGKTSGFITPLKDSLFALDFMQETLIASLQVYTECQSQVQWKQFTATIFAHIQMILKMIQQMQISPGETEELWCATEQHLKKLMDSLQRKSDDVLAITFGQDSLVKYEVEIMVGKIKEILIMARHVLAVTREVYGKDIQFGEELLREGLKDENVISWYVSAEHIDISSRVQFIEQLRDSDAIREDSWQRVGCCVKQLLMSDESLCVLARYFPKSFAK